MMGMKENKPKRKSIIHIQNVRIYNLQNIVPNRETSKYVVAYEMKTYRVHYLMYKIEKDLAKGKISQKQVDINVREDYRYKIKFTDTGRGLMKNVTVRIIPTRYPEFDTLYATFITTKWKRTGKGAIDQLTFSIEECPMITNYHMTNNICYKKVASQISAGGTHGTKTYLIIAKTPGQYRIGTQEILSNSGKTYLELPVTITL